MSYLDNDPELTGNFIVDHWRGSYSLPRTYWINNVLIANIAAAAIYLGVIELSETDLSLQLISLGQIASLLLVLAIWIWCVGGIWKSAELHPKRGGSASWAGLAKLAVVFGALGMAGQYSRAMPGIIETAEIAFGGDSLGEGITLAVEGDSLRLEGLLASGASVQVSEALEQNPDIQRVVLSSAGGRMLEGERIGDLFRERLLDTHVDGTCESACTLALLAGAKRSASFGSSIGFHQPSFPGTTQAEQKEMVEDLRAEYRTAGLPFTFISRALAANPDDMWYPREDELFAVGVLNAMDIDRVIADQLASAETINESAPTQIDEITTRVSAQANRNVLRQTYNVRANASDLNLSFFRGELAENLRQQLCSIPLGPRLVQSGAVYEFTYLDANGREITTFAIRNC